MPFVGNIHGRPSILDGTIDGMIEEANKLVEMGVFGIDLDTSIKRAKRG